MPVFASSSKNRGLKIAFKGVLFLLFMVGSASHAHAAIVFGADETGGSYTWVADNSNVSGLDISTKFTATTTGAFGTFSIRLGKNGSPVQTAITPVIYTGSIGGTLIGTCSSVNVSDLTEMVLTDVAPFVDFDCSGVPMVSGTEYFVFLFHVTRWSHVDTDTLFIGGGASNSNPETDLCFEVGCYGSVGPGIHIDDISPGTDTRTRIIDFSPHDEDLVTGPNVSISEHLYINPDDLTGQLGVRLTLHNIDQNVLLLGFLSPGDITIYDGEATTSGDVYLGGTYPLADGNYRLNATLTRSYLYGWVVNPFSSINEDQSHQFIVGTSTFIGTLSQNGFTELNQIFASTTATSTAALAGSCNPIHFDIINCLAFLFTPGGPQLEQTLVTFRDDVLQRAPWGYVTRIVNILSATTTTALPSFSTSFQVGPPGNLSTTSLSFDPGDMIAGAGTLLTNTRDPINGKNMRDVFEPLVQLAIAMAVIFTIFADLTGSHKHHQDSITHR